MRLAIATLLAATSVTAAACGGSSTGSTSDDAPAAGAAIPGGGLTIEEALTTTAAGPLVVAGYLVERDGEPRLCSAILESDPPQCGEPSLEVVGEIDDAELGQRVSLVGDVEDGVLTISATTNA
jgi:hypothetical protein